MKKEKILVWGTGVSAVNIFNEYLKSEDIFCYIDNDKSRCNDMFLGRPIICPSEICKVDYELIIIASTSSQDIYKQCINLRVNMDRVFFVYRNFKELKPLTSEKAKNNAEYLLGYEWVYTFDYHFRVITENIFSRKICENTLDNTWLKGRDYVRVRTLELLANEIHKNNIEGDTAEFGVYKGEFSRCIKRVFMDRPLYMFDTFESFRMEEAEKEMALGRCNSSFSEAFKQTSENLVRDIFKDNLDEIHIVQGLFPESLKKYPELDKCKFTFVSIDFDFEDSIYEALYYVYPRLTVGGYIMLHDYNSNLTGVKIAVERYEKKIRKKICKVPICDEYGTLVLTK